jgi:hypothetical protein
MCKYIDTPFWYDALDEDVFCFLQVAGKVPMGCQVWGLFEVFCIITE